MLAKWFLIAATAAATTLSPSPEYPVYGGENAQIVEVNRSEESDMNWNRPEEEICLDMDDFEL